MIKNKKHLSYLVLFLWISFTIHMYAFWGISTLATMQQANNNLKNQQKQKQLHNIILETKTETPDTSPKSVISDKNNRSQAPTQDLSKPEEYNVANPYLAQGQGHGGEATYVPQKEVQGEEQKVQDTKITESGIQISQNKTPRKQVASEGGGETAPTLMDVKKKQVINLYNNGTASLSTKSKDYAKYFLDMQKKIEKYHREFFPIYQYYQGLLKNGEVVVEYTLNRQGDIIDAKVISSYGSKTVDEASLNSIVYSRNFGTLPEDLQDEDVVIHFHFIYLSR